MMKRTFPVLALSAVLAAGAFAAPQEKLSPKIAAQTAKCPPADQP